MKGLSEETYVMDEANRKWFVNYFSAEESRAQLISPVPDSEVAQMEARMIDTSKVSFKDNKVVIGDSILPDEIGAGIYTYRDDKTGGLYSVCHSRFMHGGRINDLSRRVAIV